MISERVVADSTTPEDVVLSPFDSPAEDDGGGVDDDEKDGKGFDGTKLMALEDIYCVFDAEFFPLRPEEVIGGPSIEGASDIWKRTSAILVATC